MVVLQVAVDGKSYHKICFRCSHGGCLISPSNYVAHEHRLYCRHHHTQLFRQKGNFSQFDRHVNNENHTNYQNKNENENKHENGNGNEDKHENGNDNENKHENGDGNGDGNGNVEEATDEKNTTTQQQSS